MQMIYLREKNKLAFRVWEENATFAIMYSPKNLYAMAASTLHSRNIHNIMERLSERWQLTEAQLDTLCSNCTIKRLKKNEIIYREDETPRETSCLISGRVKIFKKGFFDRPAVIRTIKPIEFIGYRAQICREKYNTTAMTLEDSLLATFPIGIIMELARTNVNVALFFLRDVSEILGRLDERIVTLTQKHIRGRLAETLLSLFDKYGTTDDGCTLNIQMSRDDLASLSNMSTSNAIRTLSAFAGEALIALDGKQIRMLDFDGLDAVSRAG